MFTNINNYRRLIFWQLTSLIAISIVSICAQVKSDFPELDLPLRPVNPSSQVEMVSHELFPTLKGKATYLGTAAELPDIFSPQKRRMNFTIYPWHTDIKTTVFWVGEKATRNNPVPNSASSWDTKWSQSFGGFDDPNPKNRKGYLPKRFIPKQNPFYIALPYNDCRLLKTKASAKANIPWFKEAFYREGRTVLKGRWIAIRHQDKVCYGQWEDCGPFETDNWEYVFKKQRPRTTGNGGAGLDVSPAIREYLGILGKCDCDWRFVELHEIPEGPWKKWGHNNPFALRFKGDDKGSRAAASESITKLYELRDQFFAEKEKE